MDNSTMPQLDIFNIDKWNKLSRSEREDQFQQLEDYYADAEKRPRIKLEFGKVPSGANAQFTPGKKENEPGKIYLSDKMLSDNGFDLNFNKMSMSKADYKNYSSDYNAYRLKLIDGVIHEGRHAYQDYMIKHPEKCPEEDRDKLTLWKENMHDAVDLSGELQRVYLNPEEKGKGVYRYQPVEDDAWAFAKEQMNSIFSRTSEHDQYLYNQYREELNRKDADWELEAQNIVGLNYKQEIEKLVHDRYLNIIMEHAHSSIAKQYSSLVVDVESHNGFTTYCAANTAKSVDFAGHADPSQTIIAANNRDGLRDCDIAAGKINSDNYWLRNGLSLDGRVPDHAKRVESLTQTKQNEGGVSQQPSSGFDFHKALAAHIKRNEEMYAQLDAQRGGQNQQTQQSLSMQPKDNSGLVR